MKPSDFTSWKYWVLYEWNEWNPYRLARKVWGFASSVWAYRDLLWYDHDWDYVYLLDLMERKFSRMGEHFEQHSILVNSHQSARECRVAASLCRRLVEDNYIHGDITRASVIRSGERRQADLDYLAHLMSRKLFCWWD